MKARGFTLLELAVVVTICASLVPMIFVVERNLVDNQFRALSKIEVARAARTVSEELRRDLLSHRFDRAMTLEGACGRISYVVDEQGALVRQAPDACGGTRAIARKVSRLARKGGVVEIEFSHRLSDERARDVVVIGVTGVSP